MVKRVNYADAAERKRRQDQQRRRAITAAGREIGSIPPVKDSKRKKQALKDFKFFCEQYFPAHFYLGWSDDHLKVIAKIERAIKHGGLFAVAMPRGFGKTTMCERAVIWAILLGIHSYVYLIGSDATAADSMFDAIKTELMNNELLLEDFPEVIYPIVCLEGESRRAAGQLHHGKKTHIIWSADKVVMPTIPGSKASGSIIKASGLLGGIRGAKHTKPTGESVRPDLVVLDDPQTDQSANSPSQCAQREKVINGAVLGLAGPGKKISGVMPCTVIRQGDLADNLLNRELNPEWQGERTKMVYRFPDNTDLWDEYAQIRAQSLQNDGDGAEATEFYVENREAMDAGAEVSWSDRYDPDEMSAIQNAMNIKIRDEESFWAEYQNEPMDDDPDEVRLNADDVMGRFNGLRAGTAPVDTKWITAFIDVQEKMLYYTVVAWGEAFNGYVIDYGTYPDQKQSYFALRTAKITLKSKYKNTGTEGAIAAGLKDILGKLSKRDYQVAGGGTAKLDRILIDSGYETDIVHASCRLCFNAMPSKGVGLKAGNKPMSAYRRQKGEIHGHHWYIPNTRKTREHRHVLYDTNWWKSFIHSRIATTPGDKGSMTLYGNKKAKHRMIADHIAESESWTKTMGHGREVREWKLKPGKPDNHYFDCVVGCAVGASMLGAALENTIPQSQPKKRRRGPKVQSINI